VLAGGKEAAAPDPGIPIRRDGDGLADHVRVEASKGGCRSAAAEASNARRSASAVIRCSEPTR
jgi:hypothetical protein